MTRCALICAAIGLSLAVFAGPAVGSDLVDQALCDIDVLYVFDDPEAIDWPTLYYINDGSGARIDLATVSYGRTFSVTTTEIKDAGIYLHQYRVVEGDTTAVDSVLSRLFANRRPDIVIFGDTIFDSPVQRLAERIQTLPPLPSSLFNIRKMYRPAADRQDSLPARHVVTTNGRELLEKNRGRIQLEVPQLFPWFNIERLQGTRLIRYELLSLGGPSTRPDPDFLSDIERQRLLPLFDSVFAQGALKNAFINRARNFITFFSLSRNAVGAQMAENLITGYRELLTLKDQVTAEQLLSGATDLHMYLADLVMRAQRAVLHEIGMDWKGSIILRDSPLGPKLKFRAELSVNGPKTIELSYVRFIPYWDTAAIVLDDISRKIGPHQSFVREYLVDIDRSYLEAQMPESLAFEAEIVYGLIPLKVTTAIPIWEAPKLDVTFEPDFFFLKPAARLEIDHVVSSMNWKAVVSKPMYYSGRVTLNLVTPEGVFAGAYRQQLELQKGRLRETVRIPFSISNLFGLGIHQQTITLSVDGHEVAADTGLLRIASCEVGDTITIGLMPDSSGLLEDILRMAQANYWPLTDRTLQTGDLDAYSVILVGPGALRDYPSFRQIEGRLEDYVRYGGSLVILGQPTNWPEGVLPVSLVSTSESISARQVLNRLPQAQVLSKPYPISDSTFLARFSTPMTLSPAVISPAEKVYVTPSGATLLAVTKLGEGQIIFCGWPIIEMISELNIDAIHLLANILNY